MERKFKDWLARCHAQLDKTTRFEVLADSRLQVGAVCGFAQAAVCFALFELLYWLRRWARCCSEG